MGYTPTNWQDRISSNPGQFSATGAVPGNLALTLNDNPTQAGTPVNAIRMNNIEQGIVQVNNVYPTTNSGNAYSASPTGVTSYYDGLPVTVKFNAASTGAITVNFNGLGAKSVVDYFGNAVTNVRANLITNLRYEATSGNFILLGKGGGGNATAGDLLGGATATVDAGPITGNIPSKTAQTYTPGTTDQIIAALQYLSGAQTIQGDANLIAANILSGKSIFGVAGTAKNFATGSVSDGAGFILTVSTLPFSPTKVILVQSSPNTANNGSMILLSSTQDITANGTSYYGYMLGDNSGSLQTTQTTTNPMTSNGFSTNMATSSNTTYTYYAIG